MTEKLILFLLSFALLVSFSYCNIEASSISEYSEIQVLKSDQDGIIFKYSVPQPDFRKVQMEGVDFDQISIDKCVPSDIPGEPQLPVRIVVMGIPLEAELEVEILQVESQEQSGINLTSPLEIEKSDESQLGYKVLHRGLSKAFMLDQFFPKNIVFFDPPIFLRNQRIVRLKIYPIQYNPQKKTIRYHPQLTISVRFLGGRKEPERVQKDLFEKIYQNVLLNYEESKTWRKREEVGIFFKPSVVYPFGYSENWYKMIVRENGIYKIDQNLLVQAGVPTSEIDPTTLRIFTGGGKTLPLTNPNSFLELKELSIFVSGGEDAKFDSEDFILFYGWAVNDWDYDSTGRQASFYTNPYTYDHIFWLTFDGDFPDTAKRMAIKDAGLNEQNFFIPYKFKSRVHEEEDTKEGRETDNYRDWYWLQTDSFQRFLSLPGAVPNDTNLIKVRTKPVGQVDIRVNQEPAEIIDSLSSLTFRVASSSAFHGGLVDTLDFTFSSTVFFDYYEVEYWRGFECHNRQLFFESPEIYEVVQYEISNLFSPQIYVFDVTDKFEVRMFDGVKIDGEYAKFQDSVKADFKTRYYLLDQSRAKKPVRLFSDELSDLRKADNQADFLIITPSDFFEKVQRLKSWRTLFNQMQVKTIKVQDIYDEFSGGLFDPVAIRDFLKYASQEWQNPPAFVFLVGDGSYDYKDIAGTGVRDFIPPFPADPSPVSDDGFVWFGNTLNMIISRAPVRSESEAEIVMNKTIDYEKEPEFGNWRNLITLVADDEWVLEGGARILDGLRGNHTPDTESLSVYHIPPSFNISKVYLMEYPFDYKGEKPQAEEAIVNSFNSGSLILNYMGHGNPDVWSHESVFKTAQDIPKLSNRKKLPLVYMATCRSGFFLSPYTQGMAEELLRAEEKGAVATISAVWKVQADPNAVLNYKVFDNLLYKSLSVGEALFAAKLVRSLVDNDSKYALFGDPVMNLGVPGLEVKVTQVDPETLSALSLVNIKGEVWERGESLDTDFEGKAQILGFDSQRRKLHEIKKNGSSEYVSYNLPGLVIFRGEALVEEGRFSASFVVPKDIGYGGNTGRVGVYVFNDDQDGAGAKDSLVIWGSDTTVVDTLGPEISISFEENPDFMEGDIIPPSATLQLSLSDEHGINITGELGHGITLVIDQDYQHELDLTKNFQYDLGSFQKGALTYPLPHFSEGGHSLNIKAWDNANNSTLVSVKVEVRSETEFELTDVMNYPNPFSEETNFYYRLTSYADRVKIEIFTLAGRLIRTIPNASRRAGTNFSTTWDGKDQDGDKVANGVYIYKVVAERTTNGGAIKEEALGKAVILR